MARKIKLLQPDFPNPPSWLPLLQESYDQQWYSNFGPNATQLALEASEYLGLGRAATLVSSATAGLSATLMALGIRGKVAIPAFTFPATASAVFQAQCEVVAIDVDPKTWEMCPKALRRKLENDNIDAIIHVRSFGYCRDLSEIERVADDFAVPLIIDAAAAFGGRDPNERPVGRCGIAEVFSLHATKPFSVGEGGIVLASAELIDEVNKAINFALFGGSSADIWGMNGKMNEVSAAIGRAALRQLPTVIEYRQKMAQRYVEILSKVNLFDLPSDIGRPAWQLFSLKLQDGSAQFVQERMAELGIQTRIYYAPTINSRWADNLTTPTALNLSASMLALPMGRHITPEDQDFICSSLIDAQRAFPG